MMDVVLIIGFTILLLASIGAWINTKIMLGEIETIKKHLSVPEHESSIADNNILENK
jgi:hypothetical protein